MVRVPLYFTGQWVRLLTARCIAGGACNAERVLVYFLPRAAPPHLRKAALFLCAGSFTVSTCRAVQAPPIRHRVEQIGGLVGNRTLVHVLVRPSVCCPGRDTQDEARRGRKSTRTTRVSVVRVTVGVLHSGRAVLLLKVW